MRFVPTCYAGIKQRREPKFAVADEGAPFEYAKPKPAVAP